MLALEARCDLGLHKRPGARPRMCASGAQSLERLRLAREPIDQPERRRVRRQRPEQRLLIAHRAQV
jgi:hypothetical protein